MGLLFSICGSFTLFWPIRSIHLMELAGILLQASSVRVWVKTRGGGDYTSWG